MSLGCHGELALNDNSIPRIFQGFKRLESLAISAADKT